MLRDEPDLLRAEVDLPRAELARVEPELLRAVEPELFRAVEPDLLLAELLRADVLPDERLREPLDEPFDELPDRLEERRALLARRELERPLRRSAAGTSSRATAFASCGICFSRNLAIRSSSRRMPRASFAVSLSPTLSANASIPA